MRPSKNAFIGYTYQKYIAFLMLIKMDVEREFDDIEIEATVDNNFDDIKINKSNGETIYCQIKDIDNMTLADVSIIDNAVIIKGKEHRFDDGEFVVFFKNIEIECNSTILGFPAYKNSNVYIVSLSRQEASEIIDMLYKYNDMREQIINRFFNIRLDKRLLKIKQIDLPMIDVYDIQLLEKTINLGKQLLEFENILFIEGKPGVGKSHLVTSLSEEYSNSLIYRFWISEQDRDKETRLKYQNFIANLSKELFRDLRIRTEKEILDILAKENRTVIIDGLDHVENYNKKDLSSFINFIECLKLNNKIIVLSRPLKFQITWKKQILENWNKKETDSILKELYHITDYDVCRKIFDITDGYPILVRFISEHYKVYKDLPTSIKLNSIDRYYEEIISKVDVRNALALFLNFRSFIMESEFKMFLENDLLCDIIIEFINSYPYLFERKLNRISLFHDSLNTFLRNTAIATSSKINIQEIAYKSLIKGEKRFMSRFAFFDFDKTLKLDIIKKYSSIHYFHEIISDCIDIEAIAAFYKQIRESLSEYDAKDISISNYYDLSLIINILERDHISTVDGFVYTYVKCLLFHGYNDDDITSTGDLFAMYYYYKEDDATLIYNSRANHNYDTEYFFPKLNYEINKEENYFEQHSNPFKRNGKMNKFLNGEILNDPLEYLAHLLANLYLYETDITELIGIQTAIRLFIDKERMLGKIELKKELENFKNVSNHYPQYYLEKARDILLSLGKNIGFNEYHTLSLNKLILRNSSEGSFDVWPKVLNYIRLSLYEKRRIDLHSITNFFLMYYQRKDTTVVNIYEALKTFEDKKLISIEQSVDIIVHTQNMSEKGIRHLLIDYIEIHSPEIINIIIERYHPSNLNIVWFDLPKKFIDYFSDNLFDYALNEQLLNWHSHQREIDFKDIENVFLSKWKVKFIEIINFIKYRINISEKSPYVEELRNMKCRLSFVENEDDDKYVKTPEQRFNNGILDSDSIEFMKERNLDIGEISAYTNGYYSVLADLDIYKAYPKLHVKNNMLSILHNAIIGDIRSIKMPATLFHFPGNVPKLMSEYEIDVDYKSLYDSFMKFLDISLLHPSNKEKG